MLSCKCIKKTTVRISLPDADDPHLRQRKHSVRVSRLAASGTRKKKPYHRAHVLYGCMAGGATMIYPLRQSTMANCALDSKLHLQTVLAPHMPILRIPSRCRVTQCKPSLVVVYGD